MLMVKKTGWATLSLDPRRDFSLEEGGESGHHTGANRLTSHLVTMMEGHTDASLSYCVLYSQTKERRAATALSTPPDIPKTTRENLLATPAILLSDPLQCKKDTQNEGRLPSWDLKVDACSLPGVGGGPSILMFNGPAMSGTSYPSCLPFVPSFSISKWDYW
ncbi:hypothetical protein E2C01_022951 [Portunus trituberculatus]|uniref:Uncharacterized protein n=1 Tax=Portunus trituberculatus TaxID=210409 RepID=A0A5B7EAA0_PORTR|nr:hypothetical protein [Portunus trituberculatus]